MAGGSGSGAESILPMILMSQASQIDPLTYGQSYVNDITQTIMETIAGSATPQQQTNQAAQQRTDGGPYVRRDGLPSGEDYDQTMMDALDYVNSIAGYLEPQHYDYITKSDGTKTRVKKTDPTTEDLAYYDEHEKDADAFEKLKAWSKKRKTASTSSDGSSLLSGNLDFSGLLGG